MDGWLDDDDNQFICLGVGWQIQMICVVVWAVLSSQAELFFNWRHSNVIWIILLGEDDGHDHYATNMFTI